MAKYGKTFWGNEWLNALKNIDYSNRLPRGSSYASKGAVLSVTIRGNTIGAMVQGSRPKPYRVSIAVPEFDPRDKETLTDLLAAHPAWLAGLLNRQLPPELLKLAEREGIEIFPHQWSDFSMSCSCPDWAVPCKHLAAVVYVLANEIDLNPMLVLQLHQYDAAAALKGRQLDITESLSEPVDDLSDQLRPVQLGSLIIDERLLKEADLSRLPLLGNSFLNLLPAATPFHSGDFKAILLAHMKYAQRAEKYIAERHSTRKLQLHTCLEARLQLNSQFRYPMLRLQYEEGVKEVALPEWTVEALQAETATVAEWPVSLQLLHMYLRLSLKLLEHTAVLPKLYTAGEEHIIQWEPLLQNKEVMEVLQAFMQMTPTGLLVVKQKQELFAFPEGEATSLRICSIITGMILKEVVCHSSRFDSRDYFQQLFFGEPIELPYRIKEEQVFPNLQLWLKMLQLSEREWVPMVQVKEDFPVFTISVAVGKQKKEELQAPVPLHRFKKDPQYQSHKLRVIKDLMLLQEHFPDIGELVNSEEKSELMYSSEAFAEVLLQMLPMLQLLGMEVLLPRALRHLVKPQASLQLASTSKEKAKSWLDLQKLLDFKWQIALGDHMMDPQEFMKLVKGSKGIVKLRDRFIHLTQEDIEKLMKQLENPPSLSRQEAMRVLFAREYEGKPVQLTAELQEMLDELTSLESIPPPEGLQASLRPYQQRGYEWLYRNSRIGFGSILADDMGLGKTLQTISLLLKLKSEKQLEKAKALVVVPTSLLTNWSRELEKFAPDLSYHIYHGPKRKLAKAEGQDVLLSSYGTLRSDAEKLSKLKWKLLVIDEAQNIKNHGTAQTKAIKSIKANFKIALSGTPVENRLSEYWSIFDFTNKGFLGSAKFFTNYFARPIAADRDQQKLEAFRRLTEPFILRRLKTDKSIISDLPDKVENNLYCSLAKEQAAIYENVVNRALKQVEESEGIERKGLVLKMMTALKQICNHPYQYLKEGPRNPQHSGKLQLLLELMGPIVENREKTLIFTQYKEMGQLLVDFLQDALGTTPLFLHGSLSRQQRDELVHAFQNFRHHRIFILSLKAGGTGLNLTAAQNVVHYDLWWNPAVEAQATDRAYRIGQQKNVMVYRLLSKGTLEERIDEMIRSKRELAELAIGTGEKWLGELNNQELRDLVKLSQKVDNG